MIRSFIAIQCHLEGSDWYLLQDADLDATFLRNAVNRVRRFASMEDAAAYAAREGLDLDDHPPSVLNLDMVLYWISETRITTVDCDMFLGVWNLLADISAPIKDKPVNFKDRDYLGLYHKLYWGSRQPAAIGSEEHFKPNWSDDDLYKLRTLLAQGIELLRTQLSAV